ncbi:MAG TPA: VgrG-related protein [Tepidiformaceae bacterium]|nr:VgrG-related protein [Tepidiformaceae bacterium]
MAAVIPLLPQLYLNIGGSEVPADLSQAISRIEVDLHLYLPDMFTIELHDEGFRWVEHSLLKIGQVVEVAARPSEDEQRSPTPLLSGEVVSIEATYPESGVPTLIVRGYDLSHRLHRGRKVRSFRQMTDSDIAARIAQERGLAAEVDSTDHVHQHLYQENLSDYEFLARRARALGFVLQVEAKKLLFRKPATIALPPVELDYRSTLLDFRPRLTASAQVGNVNVRGWDPTEKRAIVGTAKNADYRTSKLKFERHGNEFAAQAFGAAETAVSDEPVASQAEGDAFAVARISHLWSGDVHADAEAIGNPRIRAGSVVTVQGVGDRFGGDYFVTNVRHTFDASGHYRTSFTVGGYGPDTTADLLFDGAGRMEEQARAVTRGVVIGIVTQNQDPEDQARVKVKFPWLADDSESHWARLASPMAGDDRGLLTIPEVNDEVLVAFEHGDFNRPYVIGALWNGVDKPPVAASRAVDGSGVVRRIFKTRAGHVIQLDDTSGKEKIEIIDKSNGNKVVIDTAANKITVDARLEVEIKGGQKVAIKAPQVEIEGTQSVKVSGAQIESAASARQKISGGIVEIN